MDGPRGARPRLARWMGMLAAVGTLAACGEELPTSVGGDLLPEGHLRTFELLLPADSFLVADTTLPGFGSTNRLTALLVAQDFQGVMDMHALLRPSNFPSTVTYRGAGDTIRVDSMPRYLRGELVVRVDTAGLGLDTLGTDTAIVFELHRLAEAWDARTATWTQRSAEAGTAIPWTQPGGTTDLLLDSATWTRGDSIFGDTIVFAVDSATIAGWSDPTDAARGALLRTPDVGVRSRLSVVRLRLFARPSARPDTVVSTGIGMTDQTFVFDPAAPPPGEELRVGGRAGWRSVLTFRDSLFEMRLPCPAGIAECDLRLRDATINSAQLRLVPVQVDELYLPQFSFLLEARRLLGSAGLPLSRAPLSDTTGTSSVLGRDTFLAPDDERITIGVSSFISSLATPPDSTPRLRERQLVLLPSPEPITFGYGAFAGIDTPGMEPLLRLVVTVAVPEEEL